MDWTGCELVQEDPRFVSGSPALKSDPRMMIEPLIDNLEAGLKPERVAKLYDVPLKELIGVYKFYKAHQATPAFR